MDFDDPERAHLPDVEVLRKALQEGRDRKIGTDSATSLRKTENLKQTVTLSKYVENTRFYSDHVFCWSRHEINQSIHIIMY